MIKAPDTVQVIPFGEHETPKGRFVLDEEGAAEIIRDFDSRKNDMVIDYEHSTLNACGEAPAAGWIKRLIFYPPDYHSCAYPRTGWPLDSQGALPPKTPGDNPSRPPLNLRGGEGGVMFPGIWAVVEWTPRAIEYLKNREYRYLSPVFLKKLPDNRVVRLINAALTNQPAIDGMSPVVNKANKPPLPLLNQGGELTHPLIPSKEGTKSSPPILGGVAEGRGGNKRKEVPMKKLLETLGLPEDATEEQATEAVMALKGAVPPTGNGGAVPPAIVEALELEDGCAFSEVTGAIAVLKKARESFGELRMSFDGLRTTASELEAKLRKRDADDLVLDAMKDGKVTPAQKDWAVSYAEADPAGFKVFVAKAPVIVPMGEIGAAVTAPVFAGGRCPLQRQANAFLGIDEETFGKYNKD